VLNHAVLLTSQERAENALRYGVHDGREEHKAGNRWRGRPAVHPIDDFDALLQRLFAEHSRTAVDYYEKAKNGQCAPVPTTRLCQLKTIWDGLLPHRELKLREASIDVMTSQKSGAEAYPGSDMSDGERAIFYFLGQCLVASTDSAIIIDEPEGHVHKAILGPLWDAIEKARPDCGFLYITHDIDFAVSRPASAKYFIRSYTHDPPAWEIAELPICTGLPDNVVAEIVGSRKPILFVEGERGSLDVTIYRHQYADFTIVPIGSCEVVIRSVATYKGSAGLHWLEAKGLVDADHRTADDVADLLAKQVSVLPVAELENILLLPEVFVTLADALLCTDSVKRLNDLTERVVQTARAHLDQVSARYTARQLDQSLKKVAHTASDLATLLASYRAEIARIDPETIFNEFKKELEGAISRQKLDAILGRYDNKGLLSLASNVLGLKGARELMERVERLLGDDEKGENLRTALSKVLPRITVSASRAARFLQPDGCQ
jgi:AAA domain, putative AbiEii toxin, Type IV TA system/Protein of unknown function (DUF4435)